MQKKTYNGFQAEFFKTGNKKMPVKEFITELTKEDQKEVGSDVRVVQENFPVGLPLVRKVKPELWEIRSKIKRGICRVFFTISAKKIVLLHAFVKKTQKTPLRELDVAVERLKEIKQMQK